MKRFELLSVPQEALDSVVNKLAQSKPGAVVEVPQNGEDADAGTNVDSIYRQGAPTLAACTSATPLLPAVAPVARVFHSGSCGNCGRTLRLLPLASPGARSPPRPRVRSVRPLQLTGGQAV